MTNFHTHTLFCDGKSSVEEMVKAAEKLGFEALGFSGHSHVAFDDEASMSPENEKAYNIEVDRAKLCSKIPIFKGIEQDFFSDTIPKGYDYIIGSVHYIQMQGEYIPVDLSADIVKGAIEKYFGGDAYAYAKEYFRLEAQVLHETGGQIAAHFDLISKFNEKVPLFDENDPRYLKAAYEALYAIIETEGIIEINTGAMARGYKSAPYPSMNILKEAAMAGGRIMLGSDCHNAMFLDYGLAEAEEIAKAAGFKSRWVITQEGFAEKPIL